MKHVFHILFFIVLLFSSTIHPSIYLSVHLSICPSPGYKLCVMYVWWNFFTGCGLLDLFWSSYVYQIVRLVILSVAYEIFENSNIMKLFSFGVFKSTFMWLQYVPYLFFFIFLRMSWWEAVYSRMPEHSFEVRKSWMQSLLQYYCDVGQVIDL